MPRETGVPWSIFFISYQNVCELVAQCYLFAIAKSAKCLFFYYEIGSEIEEFVSVKK